MLSRSARPQPAAPCSALYRERTARHACALLATAALATAAPARRPPLALSELERRVVLDVLNIPRFANCAPAAIYAQLLDEGRYVASVRTMYRLLQGCAAVRERRDQRLHPEYAKPELLAVVPNQVWSWDITKLKGPVRVTRSALKSASWSRRYSVGARQLAVCARPASSSFKGKGANDLHLRGLQFDAHGDDLWLAFVGDIGRNPPDDCRKA